MARQLWSLKVLLRLKKDNIHAGESGEGNTSPICIRAEMFFESVHTETNDALYFEARGRAAGLADDMAADLLWQELTPAEGTLTENMRRPWE